MKMSTYVFLSLMQALCCRESVFCEFRSLADEGPAPDVRGLSLEILPNKFSPLSFFYPLKSAALMRKAFEEAQALATSLLSHLLKRFVVLSLLLSACVYACSSSYPIPPNCACRMTMNGKKETKEVEKEMKALLENLVDDLLEVFKTPEWPAAELAVTTLARLLCTHMVWLLCSCFLCYFVACSPPFFFFFFFSPDTARACREELICGGVELLAAV